MGNGFLKRSMALVMAVAMAFSLLDFPAYAEEPAELDDPSVIGIEANDSDETEISDPVSENSDANAEEYNETEAAAASDEPADPSEDGTTEACEHVYDVPDCYSGDAECQNCKENGYHEPTADHITAALYACAAKFAYCDNCGQEYWHAGDHSFEEKPECYTGYAYCTYGCGSCEEVYGDADKHVRSEDQHYARVEPSEENDYIGNVEYWVCTACGQTFGYDEDADYCFDLDNITLIGDEHTHVYDSEDPTFIPAEKGHYYKCRYCSEPASEIMAHTCENGDVSCRQEGHYSICDVCHGVYGEAAPHTYVYQDAVEPTESYSGTRAHYICSLDGCDYYFAAEDDGQAGAAVPLAALILPPVDHVCYSDSEYLSNDDTYHWNTCSGCGAAMNLAEHTYSSDGSDAACCDTYLYCVCGRDIHQPATTDHVYPAASCEGDWFLCELCGESELWQDGTGHAYEEKPDCYTGYVYCTNSCGDYEYRNGDADMHVRSEDQHYARVEPSEENGYIGNVEYWVCTACGQTFQYVEDADSCVDLESIYLVGEEHTHEYDLKDPSIISTEDGHYYKCKYCSEPAGEIMAHTCENGDLSCQPEGHRAICDVCRKLYGEAAPHNFVYHEEVDSTEYEAGTRAHYTCSADTCAFYFAVGDDGQAGAVIPYAALIIPPVGHTCRSDSDSLSNDETYHWTTCNDCGAAMDLEAHSFTTDGPDAACCDTSFSCECGYEFYRPATIAHVYPTVSSCDGDWFFCELCGNEGWQEGIGHSYEEKPECYSGKVYCQNGCGNYEYRDGDADMHVRSEDQHYDCVEPSEENGYIGNVEYWVCTACGQTFRYDEAEDYCFNLDSIYLVSEGHTHAYDSENPTFWSTEDGHYHPCKYCSKPASEIVAHSCEEGDYSCQPEGHLPVCDVCHYTYGDAAPHDYVYQNAVEPTESETGMRAHYTCSADACSYYFAVGDDGQAGAVIPYAALIIPPVDHDCHSDTNSQSKDETYHWTTCDDCGAAMNLEAHTFTTDGPDAACYGAYFSCECGYEFYRPATIDHVYPTVSSCDGEWSVCELCGADEIWQDGIGHTFEEKPECYTGHAYCVNGCGYYEYVYGDADKHVRSEDQHYDRVEPSEENGYIGNVEYWICTTCGQTFQYVEGADSCVDLENTFLVDKRHTHAVDPENPEYVSTADGHYAACMYCNLGFGEMEAHTANSACLVSASDAENHYYGCSVCNYTNCSSEPHELELIAEVAATEEEPGVAEHYRCTICGVFLDLNHQVVNSSFLNTPPLDHVCADNGWEIWGEYHVRRCVSCDTVMEYEAHRNSDVSECFNGCTTCDVCGEDYWGGGTHKYNCADCYSGIVSCVICGKKSYHSQAVEHIITAEAPEREVCEGYELPCDRCGESVYFPGDVDHQYDVADCYVGLATCTVCGESGYKLRTDLHEPVWVEQEAPSAANGYVGYKSHFVCAKCGLPVWSADETIFHSDFDRHQTLVGTDHEHKAHVAQYAEATQYAITSVNGHKHVCAYCGAAFGEEIPHDLNLVQDDGTSWSDVIDYYTCDDCGICFAVDEDGNPGAEITTFDTALPVPGHECTWAEGENYTLLNSQYHGEQCTDEDCHVVRNVEAHSFANAHPSCWYGYDTCEVCHEEVYIPATSAHNIEFSALGACYSGQVVCPDCGEFVTDLSSNVAHTPDAQSHVEAVAPCEENGYLGRYEYWTCSECGKYLYSDTTGIDVSYYSVDDLQYLTWWEAGHAHAVLTNFAPYRGDAEGHYSLCSYCNNTYGEYLDHDLVYIEEGNQYNNQYVEAHWECSECGFVFRAAEDGSVGEPAFLEELLIPAEGHVCEFGEVRSNDLYHYRACQEMACSRITDAAYHVPAEEYADCHNGFRVCAECGLEYWKNGTERHTLTTSITPATAADSGVISTVCEICGDIIDLDVIPAIGSIELSEDAFEYNGEVQQPEVTVFTADGTEIPSEFYTVSYASGCIKAGMYKVTVTFRDHYSGTADKYFRITPKTVFEFPEPINGLVYTGNEQPLVTAGSTSAGTMLYSLDRETYTTDLPCGVDAGGYTIFVKIVGAEDLVEDDLLYLEVDIEQAAPVVTAPEAKDLAYTGKAQELVTAGSTSAGVLVYSLDGNEYSEALPTGVECKTYTVYYKVMGDSNVQDTAPKTLSVTIRPETPAVPTVSNVSGGVKVTWNAAKGATKYRVYRKTSSTDSWTKLVDTTDTSITDTDVTSGKAYYYTVKAISPSSSKYDTTGTKIIYLSASTVSASNVSTGVAVTWTKVAGASGYYLYRSTDGTNYTRIAVTTGDTLTFTDTGRTNAQKCMYKVFAYRTSGSKTFKSASSKIKTYYWMKAPAISSVTNSAAGKATVVWSQNKSCSGYQVKYVTGTTTKTVTVKGKATLTTVLSKLTKGSTYKVSVRAYKTVDGSNYYSAWSSAKSVKIAK